MSDESNDHEGLVTSVEHDLARLQAFLDRERGALLGEARRQRDRAGEEERRWVERPLLGLKEMERRLEEGIEALMVRMDDETAAATARLVAALAASQPAPPGDPAGDAGR